jgi:CDP-diacylglycerol---serine O-phosphatidyltransferase
LQRGFIREAFFFLVRGFYFMKKQIPNLFTLGNLVCGSIAVLKICQEGFYTPYVFLLFLAGFFDVLDGAVARALKVSGEMGRELDSLADVVSFGLAPSVIAYQMLSEALPPSFEWMKYLAFINVACAAHRLAKFNISTDQTTDFSGMPSPANGLFWGAISVAAWDVYANTSSAYFYTSFSPWVILSLLFLTSFLMVSTFRMFSFKMKGGLMQNKIQLTYIITALLLPVITFIIWHSIFAAVPIAIVVYMGLSGVYHARSKS